VVLLLILYVGWVQDYDQSLSLDDVVQLGNKHLNKTVYLSDEHVESKLKGQVGQGTEDSQDMLSLAIQITSDSFRNLKVIHTTHQ